MTENILNWNEIQKTYKDSTILIGNGASIAISDNFSYKKIFELIEKINTKKTNEIKNIFSGFKSDDFEFMQRKLLHAHYVNRKLDIQDNKKIENSYKLIRKLLILAIRKIHPQHHEIKDKLTSLYEFIKYFKIIVSLNYDLLIYWAVMKGKDTEGYIIKDCFGTGIEFDPDWPKYKEAIKNEMYSKLVFYLHGNIALAHDKNENEIKINSEGNNLLDNILKKWNNDNYTPLFVSEGTAEQKKQAIKRSPYLRTIFDEVLQNLPNNYLTIYGFNFSDQDLYILDQIAKNKNKIVKVAVSVYKDGKEAAYFSRVKEKLEKHLNITDNNIDFFDSTTVGEWSKKTDKASNIIPQQPEPTSQKYENDLSPA
jgi:hypothetical protein